MPLKQKKDATKNSIADSSAIGKLLLGFKVVHVFDISQTDADPLPEPPKVDGCVGANLQRIQRVVTKSGIELEFNDLNDSQGSATGGKFVIDRSVTEAETFQMLAREQLLQVERKTATMKTVKETEADAVGFIISNAFGLDSFTHSAD